MKHSQFFPILFSLFVLFISLSSCNNEEQVLLDEIEILLPGQWHIDEMTLDPSPSINYFGKILTEDTTLTDVGILNIPPFFISELDLNSERHVPIEAELDINGVSLDVQIERLFLSGLEYFAYLRTVDFPQQDTPEGIFISDTRLFMKNHYIDVIDDNTIIIREASGEGPNRMRLSKQ